MLAKKKRRENRNNATTRNEIEGETLETKKLERHWRGEEGKGKRRREVRGKREEKGRSEEEKSNEIFNASSICSFPGGRKLPSLGTH